MVVTPMSDPPKHAQVLVIGGGPSGSYAASVLAREGIDVVLFEAAQFPRYHIGESLLPSVRHFLRFVDAEEKVVNHGFTRKPGAVVKFSQHLPPGYTDFVALGASNSSWNVVRSEFDQIVLRHAAESGAKVYEETRVTELRFDTSVSKAPGRPQSALYETKSGVKGEITFDYLVDASGRAGIMSTKYLKNRKFNSSLKNVAQWGYWKNTGIYGKDTRKENAPVFEALTDESGWCWYIPLHKGLTSVGIVMDQTQLGIRNREMSSSPLVERYRSFIELAPTVRGLIGDGELVAVKSDEDDGPGEGPTIRSASDYSYSAPEYSGPGFRIVGDASAFIDPFFSSGVHLAFTGGLSAAASIAASIRGDCSEELASAWHTSRVSLSYTRFLLVVLSAYKQIRGQSTNALADIQENNFDKAFAFLRPVIQGGADMGTRLTEDEVDRAVEFCSQLFAHTNPEQHDKVRQELESMTINSSSDTSASRPNVADLFDIHAPVVAPAQLDEILRPVQASGGAQSQAEIRTVLNKVNARRLVHAEYGNELNSLEAEDFEGYVLRLKKGVLGLQKLDGTENAA
ncbi:FAD/NAD-P-binding domain-containing protein [Daedaleopsis nitida]|nr:FAD/NAD-P-binding domain-containing protein [Daedaleopsis nitida]